MFVSIERIALALFAGAVTLIAVTMAFALPDPLASGAPRLTDAKVRQIRLIYDHKLIWKDDACALKPDQIGPTEVALSSLPGDVCASRTQELVYLGTTSNTLVACLNQNPEFAMKVAIGSNGLGKTRQGNRKSPIGTYWLGYPRHSAMYGIFIPVGYPNLTNIALGRTGSAIGLHGPVRGLQCFPELSLARNWTAGCIAVGRDSQIIALSEWILAHWPVKIVLK